MVPVWVGLAWIATTVMSVPTMNAIPQAGVRMPTTPPRVTMGMHAPQMMLARRVPARAGQRWIAMTGMPVPTIVVTPSWVVSIQITRLFATMGMYAQPAMPARTAPAVVVPHSTVMMGMHVHKTVAIPFQDV
jgi:hypothetical protein